LKERKEGEKKEEKGIKGNLIIAGDITTKGDRIVDVEFDRGKRRENKEGVCWGPTSHPLGKPVRRSLLRQHKSEVKGGSLCELLTHCARRRKKKGHRQGGAGKIVFEELPVVWKKPGVGRRRRQIIIIFEARSTPVSRRERKQRTRGETGKYWERS